MIIVTNGNGNHGSTVHLSQDHHDGPAFSSSALHDIAALGKNVNN